MMLKKIVCELKNHSPFTSFGALTGILLMLVFRNIPHETAHALFYVFHPLHVFLSALVTTAVYCRYQNAGDGPVWKTVKILFIGYIGSVGIGTLSDSLIPFWGEQLMGMSPEHHHIGFIEKWWLINPLAFAGIGIAWVRPGSKFPHAGHVLLSTWASLFHMMMASHGALSPLSYAGIFLFLFLAVWIPCCLSDIVFPLLFIKEQDEAARLSQCSCRFR